MGLNPASLMYAKFSHISDEFASGVRQVVITYDEKQLLGQFNLYNQNFHVSLDFLPFPLQCPPLSFFWVSSGKVLPLPTSSSTIPFCFSTVGKLLVTHKILGVRILALHNLREPPRYTAFSFQLFEILLHLKAYVEFKPGSKCAYIILLFLK